MLSKTLFVGAAAAIVVAFLLDQAPGEPEWSSKPVAIVSEPGVAVHHFAGGDGTTKLTGRLHYPTTTTTSDADTKATIPPVVILAHGGGMTETCHREQEPFVRAFVQAGWAAFTFDYATFGSSDGAPRNQISPNQQVGDLQAAIRFIRQGQNDLLVDASRIALYGFSYGGGHVLSVAAQDPSIRAVIAHSPWLASAFESVLGTTMLRAPGSTSLAFLKLAIALFKAVVWKALYGKTWYIPIVGMPGSVALTQNEGDKEGYLSLTPQSDRHLESGTLRWKNAVAVLSVVPTFLYRPLNHVKTIQSPTLLIAAERDQLSPLHFVTRAAKLIGDSGNEAQVIVLPNIGHFDMHNDEECLQNILVNTTDFLRKHLLST